MAEVCHNVSIESHLQPLSGEDLHVASSYTEAGARLDMAACGFWGGRFDRAFFEVRVFHLRAQSNRRQYITLTYRKHENIKK